MTELKSWRQIPAKTGSGIKKRGTFPKPPIIPAICILDGLYFIGDEYVGCYILDTGDGLIMIDCTCNSDYHYELIKKGFEDLELDIQNIKYIFITHGHFDHYGKCERFREESGARILMSKADYELASTPGKTPFPAMPCEPDMYIEDGDVLALGLTTMKFYLTGGHTPASVSAIFNVFDEGKPRTAGIFGGSSVTPFMKEPEIRQFLDSARRWRTLCEECHVDTLLCSHPFEINAKEKICLIRNVNNRGVSNPFVLGREGCRMYENLLIARGEEGLNNANKSPANP